MGYCPFTLGSYIPLYIYVIIFINQIISLNGVFYLYQLIGNSYLG